MGAKKILTIALTVVFCAVIIFSGIMLLGIQKINVDFSVLSYSDSQYVASKQTSEDVQNLLEEYLNKNLLFLDTEQVKEKVKTHPRIEVVEVQKKYPNQLVVQVKERREVYSLIDETTSKTYILNEEGYVLADNGETRQNSNLISFTLENVKIESALLGEKLKVAGENQNVALSTALEIAKQVGLADCIKNIRIKDYTNGCDAFFQTHTGVEIQVLDIVENGTHKAINGFNMYDQKASDYQKRFGTILAHYTMKDGIKILAVDYIGGIYGDSVLLEQPLSIN